MSIYFFNFGYINPLKLNNMILSELNYLAVAVCAVIYFGIGGMWYSPIMFAKPWMAGHGITMPSTDEEKAKMRKGMGMLMGTTFIMGFIGVMALAYMETAMFAKNWMTGAKCGIIASVFACLAMGLNYLYTRKSMKIYIIDVGYHLVSLVIVGIILSVWR